MKRIVSVWLPMWPIERLCRHSPGAVPDDRPFALVESSSHGIRITALNACAAMNGVRRGTSLADARAALPSLLSRPAEPARDRAALLKLACWAGRYGPSRNTWGADGFWIDITGVAHLFGGEAALLDDLIRRLARFGLTTHVGLAGTIGAAHALARFAPQGNLHRIAPPGEEKRALAALPVEALRLDAETSLLLKRLGLRRIGQLYGLPRAALERRFSSELSARSRAPDRARFAGAVLMRLDHALNMRDEPLRSLGDPPALCVRRSWREPLISSEALEHETEGLAAELSEALKIAGLGCRRIRLTLYRADGTLAEVNAGLSRASRDAGHLARLLKEKLSAFDAGFGIDVAVLDALSAEPLGAAQIALTRTAGLSAEHEIGTLVDRISNRLGTARITCLVPHESHLPERSETHVPIARSKPGEDAQRRKYSVPRPPFLLTPPEPITVMAEIPEGPPMSFTWRRVRHRIVKAEGPERIAPEWWKSIGVRGRLGASESRTPSKTRDYYRLEDDEGAGFWVFRDGLYQSTDETGPPGWFLHGLFG
jgi:protein ImuB